MEKNRTTQKESKWREPTAKHRSRLNSIIVPNLDQETVSSFATQKVKSKILQYITATVQDLRVRTSNKTATNLETTSPFQLHIMPLSLQHIKCGQQVY